MGSGFGAYPKCILRDEAKEHLQRPDDDALRRAPRHIQLPGVVCPHLRAPAGASARPLGMRWGVGGGRRCGVPKAHPVELACEHEEDEDTEEVLPHGMVVLLCGRGVRSLPLRLAAPPLPGAFPYGAWG